MPNQRRKTQPRKRPVPQKAKTISQEEKEYFEAKKTVVDFEVKESTEKHDFETLKSTLTSYGEFLERHPEAEPPVAPPTPIVKSVSTPKSGD